MDIVKSSGDQSQSQHEFSPQFPGVHIGHIAVYYRGYMIVLSGYGGYKVRDNFLVLICICLLYSHLYRRCAEGIVDHDVVYLLCLTQ